MFLITYVNDEGIHKSAYIENYMIMDALQDFMETYNWTEIIAIQWID